MGRCARGRRGRESDSSLSPARPRVGDDRRAPPVICCGAGERQGGLAVAMWPGWAAKPRLRRWTAAWVAGPRLAGQQLGFCGLLRGMDRGLLTTAGLERRDQGGWKLKRILTIEKSSNP
jgi:hypothetical protein